MEFFAVHSFGNYVEAHIIMGRLKDEGIDCWLKNENTNTLVPLWSIAIGGIQLMVNGRQLQQARYVLQTIAAERKAALSCPACGSHEVEFINTVRKPVNWLSAIASFLLGDYALLPVQRYHCFGCGKEWKGEEEAAV